MPPRKNEPPEAIRPALATRMVSIDDLSTLPGNPRRGDIERIKASLTRFGQRYPSVVRDNVLLAGNNRLQAMRELGWTHVVVVDADDLTDEEAQAFALADNRSSDLAEYDEGALLEMLERLDAELLDASGYDQAFYVDLLESLDFGSPLETPAEEGAVIHNQGGAGLNLHDVAPAWNAAATRMFILTYELEQFTQVEKMFERLRVELELESNSDVVLHLLREATE